jgi:hypothetical protein
MKSSSRKRRKGFKIDGTPKKIVILKCGGRPWAGKLNPHYEDIRLRRARGETYKEIAKALKCAQSTVASFVRTHSDGTKPYTLRDRSTAVTAPVLTRPSVRSKPTSLVSNTLTPITAGDAMAGIPYGPKDYV